MVLVLSKTMCWSDIFHGESGRETMLKECRKLKALLGDCFTTINHLIDRIEENFPGEKLEKIYVQSSACLGDNCIIIMERINQIEKLLEEREFDMETRIDTKLFKELKNRSRKFEIKVIKISNSKGLLIGIVIGFILAFVCWTKNGMRKCTIENILNFVMIKITVFVLLLIVILFVGITIVLSIIFGSSRREKLNLALGEYARAVEDFEPIARKFCWNIGKVIELMEVHNKK
ncbi:hypothetical protein CHS0354_001927 [Potamilus streckersoni]|uniref:Uncharacterized protein n=1 Tax=Potamilus streckersoni TaxID=2493646 RepID=A0AAE0VTI6_9BIVA|nr:hypothetical protein CHS0354_001927 [Potamilus streckersoni]